MGIRGTKSAASLAIVPEVEIDHVRRPGPPAELLDDEQRQEWLAIVNRLPAEWFPRETHGLLAQYCRHVVAARRIASLVHRVESQENLDLGEYDKLLQMQEREGRAMSSLATRMRLTQQSTYDKSKQKPGKPANLRPWAIPRRAEQSVD